MLTWKRLLTTLLPICVLLAITLLPDGMSGPEQSAHAAVAPPTTPICNPNLPANGIVQAPPPAPLTSPYKFDFGPGPVAPGYTQVLQSTAYNTVRGYGFTDTTGLTSVDRGAPDNLRRAFITSNKPFTFNANIPNGNYTVTVTLGDDKGTSATTVKAQFGRVVLNKVTTASGAFTQQAFTVNVITGQLNLQFAWTAPKIDAVEIQKVTAPTIFMAGDSTVCDQPPMADNPYLSYGAWGQMLTLYLKSGIAVADYAAAGRTSISFINEGRLDAILRVIKPEDYLFIQFGHNDEHAGSGSYPFTTYKAALQKYIDGARQHHAIPILVTPVARRSFDSNGKIIDTHGNFPVAMRQLAAADNVPLLDLTALSMSYFQTLGPIGTQSVFLFLKPGQSPDFPNGVSDNTHFSVNGGIQVAQLVAGAIKTQNIQPLASFFK